MSLKPKPFVCLFFCVIIFISCKKNGGSSPSNVGNPTSMGECKSCAYTPDCSNIKYTYQDNVSGSSPTTRVLQYSTVIDTLIEGTVYQKLATNIFQNCNSGVTTTLAYNSASLNSNAVLTKAIVVPLKANAAIGTTWTDHLTNASGEDIQYDYTIAEKGIDKIVLGVKYSNVIHVSVPNSINYPGYGNIPTGQSEYYYAENIGLIEADLSESGTLVETTYLVSYNIPN